MRSRMVFQVGVGVALMAGAITVRSGGHADQ